MRTSERPLLIECAVTPLVTPIQTTEEMIHEAKEALAAGASIIHHHHDYKLSKFEGIKQMITVGKGILESYPHAFIYPNYLRGSKMVWDRNEHLEPMADAGVLRMIAMDPGITIFAPYDEEGIPSKYTPHGFPYPDALELMAFAREHNVPFMLGIYEPGQLKWVVACAKKGLFPAGTMIKLYFTGDYVFGGHGKKAVNPGLPATKQALEMYLSLIEGCDLPWQAAIFGEELFETELPKYALERGGHIRVGVEDSTFAKKQLSNRELVEVAKSLANEVGRPVIHGEEADRYLRKQVQTIS